MNPRPLHCPRSSPRCTRYHPPDIAQPSRWRWIDLERAGEITGQVALLGNQWLRHRGPRVPRLRAKSLCVLSAVVLALTLLLAAGAEASTFAVSTPRAGAVIALVQQRAGNALAQARSTAPTAGSLADAAQTLASRVGAAPPSPAPGVNSTSVETVAAVNVQRTLASALPGSPQAPGTVSAPLGSAANTVSRATSTLNSAVTARMLASQHHAERATRQWLAAHGRGRRHTPAAHRRAPFAVPAQRQPQQALPESFWRSAEPLPSPVRATVTTDPAAPTEAGERRHPHQSRAVSRDGGAVQSAAPPSVPLAPAGGGAAGGAGSGIGGAPAAALLAAAALWLLQSLLSRRLPFDLPPWRSALPASPPDRPG
jgi:hypothetical protein